MRIVSPVDRLSEAELLLDAGADELYGGYVPAEWTDRFSLLASINQRTFEGAQIDSRTDLVAIVEAAHSRAATFSLTLNAPFYSDEQMPLILDYVDSTVEIGIDGVILADLALIRILRERHPDLEYHASTLAHLTNSEAVRFYASRGVSRVIFPRHLAVAEMREIVKKVPDVRFDAFLLVGKCPNTEGLCTFHHSSSDRIWPCEIPYDIEPLEPERAPDLRNTIKRQENWAKTDRRHGCGLCAIPDLMKMGIWGLKLVGRGAPTAQKIRNIALVREFVSLAGSEIGFETYCRRARKSHLERFGAPCSNNVCYYPEFYKED